MIILSRNAWKFSRKPNPRDPAGLPSFMAHIDLLTVAVPVAEICDYLGIGRQSMDPGLVLRFLKRPIDIDGVEHCGFDFHCGYPASPLCVDVASKLNLPLDQVERVTAKIVNDGILPASYLQLTLEGPFVVPISECAEVTLSREDADILARHARQVREAQRRDWSELDQC